MEAKGSERREYERHKVYGGNAEIDSVFGRGKKPGERARVVNWSRGGLLLKVPSPRRRFLVQKMDPVLYEDDTVTCTLRLPPQYTDISVSGEVVHVKRDDKDQDVLEVGVRFDLERTPPEKLAALARILEPKARTMSGKLKRISATSQRISQKLAASEAAEAPAPAQAEAPAQPRSASRRSKRVSGRVAHPSGRSRHVTQRLEQQS
ncbi:MAG: PilZ domain-containing protein [Planctomycetota bacterium]